MKTFIFSLLILLSPIMLVCQSAKKVLVIGIDGCRSDALQVANTPNIDSLINNGIFAPDALNDDITISGPGWSAILCGVWSDKHLVTGNNFTVNNYEDYPPFFKYLNDFDPDINSLSICHWSPINDFIVQDYADFKLNVSTDAEVASQASAYISNNDPDVAFLHFDDVDHAGHDSGFTSNNAAYIAAIESVDAQVGTVMQAVKNRATYAEEDWLIILAPDHGGNGFSHGGNTFGEENVFIIVSGDDVEQATILRDSSIVVNNTQNCLGEFPNLEFDSDEDVNVPPNSIFDFNVDQDFTIECRVRTTSNGDVAIIGNKNWNSGTNKGFVFSFKYPAGPEWKVNIGDGSNRADINTGGEIADNEWHTLSVSFDRDGWMKMYQDGMILDSADISSIGDITTNAGLFFGTDINGDFGYSGSIAEVRVWDTLVGDEAINDWSCVSVENSHPNYEHLIGYWKLNEGTGETQAIDYSLNANHGVINGASWVTSDSVVVYDYSTTRRLTDIVPTVLTHLCIPIQEAWGLDGSSLISDCNITAVEDSFLSKMEWEVFPNPTKGELCLNLKNVELNSLTKLEIYDSAGAKVYEQFITSQQVNLDISDFSPGVYFVKLSMGANRWVSEKIVKY